MSRKKVRDVLGLDPRSHAARMADASRISVSMVTMCDTIDPSGVGNHDDSATELSVNETADVKPLASPYMTHLTRGFRSSHVFLTVKVVW